jgi:hypothetical protein
MPIINLIEAFSKKKRLFVFFLLPLIFVITSLINRQQLGPYWLGMNSDPEYAYLLNFLNIIQLKTPGHTDHPGTPLQIFGGIIIQITYLVQSLAHSVTTSVTETVLQNPDFYLVTVNTILLIITTICLLLLGFISFSLDRNIILSLLLQLAPFLSTTLDAAPRVSPEILLLCLTQLLVILLLFYLYSEVDRLPKFSLAIGAILGLGIAVKVTFLPLLLVILLLPGLRQKGIAILSTIGTFFLATLPILSQYPRLFNWLTSIATHTGHYGGGNQGLIDVSGLPSTFAVLLEHDRLFFYIISLSALNFLIVTFYFSWYRSKEPISQNSHQGFAIKKLYRLFACLLSIVLVQLLLTLKHPNIHYLIPSMGLCGLLILVQVSLVAQILTPVLKPIILSSIGLFAFGICVVAISPNIYNKILQKAEFNKSYIGEIQTINSLIQQKYPLCTHVRYYRSSDRAYALKFGNDFAANQFSQPLQSMYPNAVFYNIWSRKYESFNQELNLNTLLNEKKCVIFQGSPFTQQRLQHMPNAKLEKIFEGQNEALYLVVQRQN